MSEDFIPLTKEQRTFLRRLTRLKVLKIRRQLAAGPRKFGADYDPARPLARLHFAETVFVKLGGDLYHLEEHVKSDE